MLKLGKKLSRWFKRQARVNRTVRELSALSNRELSDIGISRSDIHRVATDTKSQYREGISII